LIRILCKPMADAFQGGRWKEHNCMPLRFAEETKFLAQIWMIADVCADCEAALGRVGVDNWPGFGGWDLLMQDRFGGGVAVDVEPMVAPQQGVDLNDDSGDEDSARRRFWDQDIWAFLSDIVRIAAVRAAGEHGARAVDQVLRSDFWSLRRWCFGRLWQATDVTERRQPNAQVVLGLCD
jgi:hypothetical protein